MKEKIYTIPINEAFDRHTECPICSFLKKEEQERVEYTLGASMMEPDVRCETNAKGFCNAHSQMLYDFGNRLSYALVLETRLDYLENELKKIGGEIDKHLPKKLSVGKTDLKKAVLSGSAEFSKTVSTCALCEWLDKVTNDFVDNILYLCRTSEEFKEKFFASKGFCVRHFELLLEKSAEHFGDVQLSEFLKRLFKLEIDSISRIKEDVNWFTKKFDYRYANEDWKNSRDAVKRGCEKTAMYISSKD